MGRPFSHRIAGLLIAASAVAACGSSPRAGGGTNARAASPSESDLAAIAKARADSARYPYTEADIQFMSRMIGHHAQAIEMARLAPGNGASQSVRTLAERIINAQQDEITIMQQWLRDRGLPVPEARSAAMPMHHGDHQMMPGMITAAQMKQLEGAKGTEFDRLFLNFMIQHHRGAVVMVEQLIATPGGAQDQTVFNLASDVNVDQTTEVARMTQMLAALLFDRPPG